MGLSKVIRPDAVHPKVAKLLAKDLVKPLIRLFNALLNERRLPMDRLKPVHKVGDGDNSGSSRPVNLKSI